MPQNVPQKLVGSRLAPSSNASPSRWHAPTPRQLNTDLHGRRSKAKQLSISVQICYTDETRLVGIVLTVLLKKLLFLLREAIKGLR